MKMKDFNANKKIEYSENILKNKNTYKLNKEEGNFSELKKENQKLNLILSENFNNSNRILELESINFKLKNENEIMKYQLNLQKSTKNEDENLLKQNEVLKNGINKFENKIKMVLEENEKLSILLKNNNTNNQDFNFLNKKILELQNEINYIQQNFLKIENSLRISENKCEKLNRIIKNNETENEISRKILCKKYEEEIENLINEKNAFERNSFDYKLKKIEDKIDNLDEENKDIEEKNRNLENLLSLEKNISSVLKKVRKIYSFILINKFFFLEIARKRKLWNFIQKFRKKIGNYFI